eukprot:scaffold63590_cov36-Tisochrysis_lutea.AAC.1
MEDCGYGGQSQSRCFGGASVRPQSSRRKRCVRRHVPMRQSVWQDGRAASLTPWTRCAIVWPERWACPASFKRVVEHDRPGLIPLGELLVAGWKAALFGLWCALASVVRGSLRMSAAREGERPPEKPSNLAC